MITTTFYHKHAALTIPKRDVTLKKMLWREIFMIQVGVVSRTFPEWAYADVAARMRELGFVSTELCFTFKECNVWAYNGSADLSPLTGKRAAEIVKTFRDSGIYIASLGAFSSMFEPDAEKQAQNLRTFERYFQVAADNGIPAVATEAGFIPGRRGIMADTYEKDFDYFKSNLMKVLEMAERYGVDLALENCVLDFAPSAKRARDLILQCGSKRFKVLLDPANLIANSDEEDMFKYLASYISYFHGKDRKVNDASGRVVGDGEIDWPLFLKLYHERCEGVPFILEYVTPDNCAEIRDRVLAFDGLAVSR